MTNEGTTIRTTGLVKDYGRLRALAGVDLEVRRGEVFGFLGPNGAGKSTLIRVLLGLLAPTAGKAHVLGREPSAGGAELRARIGYLPGELHMRGNTTAGNLLEYLADLRGTNGRARIDVLAERLDLDLGRPIRGLSKGNKQKVGLVQAFMHRPELLVLDEPTSGLDPLLQREFLALVNEARDDGATVFMSSHVLSEVERAADRVGVIRAGRLLDVSDVRTLRHRAGQRVELRFAQAPDHAVFEGVPGLSSVVWDDASLRCVLQGEPDALLKVAARYRVVSWSARERELEELFMDYYRHGEGTAAAPGAPVAERAVPPRVGADERHAHVVAAREDS
ncbi:MAG: ABC transporter ATP-binding protein [Trueperaceae bacterium]